MLPLCSPHLSPSQLTEKSSYKTRHSPRFPKSHRLAGYVQDMSLTYSNSKNSKVPGSWAHMGMQGFNTLRLPLRTAPSPPPPTKVSLKPRICLKVHMMGRIFPLCLTGWVTYLSCLFKGTEVC